MKRYIAMMLFYLIGCMGYGLDVDKTELAFGIGDTVTFINYEGPHSKIETIDEIYGIGLTLADDIPINGSFARADYFGKYSVIHAVDLETNSRLDADIFVIEKASQVDHIDNVRMMIGGYFEEAYGYEREDALLLAEFVTYYNAVFRNEIDYFQQKYKPIVLENLSAERVGIAVAYTDWPGETQIVIPLTEEAQSGNLSSLDSDTLTEEEVLEELRKQEDKGVPQRQDITELKEREIEEQQKEQEEEKSRLEEESEELAQKQQKTSQEKEEIEEEIASLDEEEGTAGEDTAAEREQLESQKAALEEKQAEEEAQAQELAEREAELKEQEEKIREREERVQAERESIAEDTQDIIEEEEEKAETARRKAAAEAAAEAAEESADEEAPGDDESEEAVLSDEVPVDEVRFLKIADISGEPSGQILIINRYNGEILKRSTINTIRGRSMEIVDGQIAVLAGKSSGTGAIRLLLLDAETLETIKEGSHDIYEESVLAAQGTTLYVVVRDEEEWYLGKFDTELNLLGRSRKPVVPYTSITFGRDEVFVQGKDGSILMLNKEDLTAEG